jgi:hypothetical protein
MPKFFRWLPFPPKASPPDAPPGGKSELPLCAFGPLIARPLLRIHYERENFPISIPL